MEQLFSHLPLQIHRRPDLLMICLNQIFQVSMADKIYSHHAFKHSVIHCLRDEQSPVWPVMERLAKISGGNFYQGPALP